MGQEESSQKKRESERREKMGVGRDVSGFIRLCGVVCEGDGRGAEEC